MIMSGMGGLNARTKKLLLTVITSGLYEYSLQHILSFGKIFRVYHTKLTQIVLMAEDNNSGKVKVDRIRQPACLWASETERMWVEVIDFCLRYSPSLGRLKDTKRIFKLIFRFYSRLQHYTINHFLINSNQNEFLYTVHGAIVSNSLHNILILLLQFSTMSQKLDICCFHHRV